MVGEMNVMTVPEPGVDTDMPLADDAPSPDDDDAGGQSSTDGPVGAGALFVWLPPTPKPDHDAAAPKESDDVHAV